jgi:hypothetical protein
VDDAPTFPEMLVQLEKWLDGHGLRDDDYLIDALWVTDGVSEQERLLLEFHTRADAPIRSLGIYGKPLQLAFRTLPLGRFHTLTWWTTFLLSRRDFVSHPRSSSPPCLLRLGETARR